MNDGLEPCSPVDGLDIGDGTSVPFATRPPGGVMLCFACRRLDRCRLGMQSETLQPNGVVVSNIVCSAEQEGGPQVAHGGWTAGMLDELVGHTLLLRNEFAVTGTLEVVFTKPVPIERPLVGTATVVKREGRRVHVTADLTLAANGALLATAKAILVMRPADHYVRHQKWLSARGD